MISGCSKLHRLRLGSYLYFIKVTTYMIDLKIIYRSMIFNNRLAYPSWRIDLIIIIVGYDAWLNYTYCWQNLLTFGFTLVIKLYCCVIKLVAGSKTIANKATCINLCVLSIWVGTSCNNITTLFQNAIKPNLWDIR